MYYSITGSLILKEDNLAVIEAAGVAYELLVSAAIIDRLPAVGQTVTLFSKLIVRENEMFLVGFLSPDERKLFDSLMTVSGIGPKQALKVLSEMSVSDVRNAIISGNESMLSRVKGIGPKTASRIILELKDKIRKLQLSESAPAPGGQEKKKFEILLAMRVLGYSDQESRRVIDSVFSHNESVKDKEVEDIIKIILSSMAR